MSFSSFFFQVYNLSANIFVDGVGTDYIPAGSYNLSSPVLTNSPESRVGQNATGEMHLSFHRLPSFVNVYGHGESVAHF